MAAAWWGRTVSRTACPTAGRPIPLASNTNDHSADGLATTSGVIANNIA
jgi:hypothetical protein